MDVAYSTNKQCRMILMLMMMMFTLILVQMSDYSEGDANDDDVNDGG